MIGYLLHPIFHADDNNGIPLEGGKLYSYAYGSTTPKKLYRDSMGVSEHTNPVILDSRGEATIYGDGIYRLELYDKDDNLIWTTDSISAIGSTESIISALGIENVKDIQDSVSYNHKHNTDRKPPEVPNGVRTGFSTAERFVASTLDVYVNGMMMTKDYDYTEDEDRKGYNFNFALRYDEVVQHRYLVDIG